AGKIDGHRPIIIGIVGEDPFGESFREVEGKRVKASKRRLAVKRFGRYGKNTDLSGCDLLFVCELEKKHLSGILGLLKGKPVLTVGECSGFLEAGGMIDLVRIKNKIRWEINRTPVKKAQLKMSAQLLRNATRVVEIPKLKGEQARRKNDKAQRQ
ncbi:MAG: YfiR family protein, partial [Planctomycetes bacterium]|nr:YfiR family protein [Planctomycetota bacterium]